MGNEKDKIAISKKSKQLWEKGAQLILQGKAAEAETILKKVVELTPENGEAWYTLGQAYYNHEKWTEALKAYTRSSELAPNEEQPWCNMGVVLAKLGRKDEAIKTLERALELNHNYATARRNLAKLKGGMAGVLHSGLADATEHYGSLEAGAEAVEEMYKKEDEKKKKRRYW